MKTVAMGVTVKVMKTAERHLFPVSSQGLEELKTGNGPTIPWKSVLPVENDIKGRGDVHAPGLELALGVETKSPNQARESPFG